MLGLRAFNTTATQSSSDLNLAGKNGRKWKMDGDGERREEGGREGVEGGRHKLRINFTFFCSHSYALFFGFQYMYMYFCFLFHSQQFFLPVTF